MLRNTHLYILVFLLIVFGVSLTLYQHFRLGLPWQSDELETVWSIEAKVEFQARPKTPVKVSLTIPQLNQNFVALNESFVSRNYGVTIRPTVENRYAIWSIRRATGKQTLYYRLTIYKQAEKVLDQPVHAVRPLYEAEGAEELAINGLLDPIRSQSSDIATFTAETLKRLNNPKDENAKLLLGGDFSIHNVAHTAVKLLSMAHIHAKVIYGVELEPGRRVTPTIWLASHNEQQWIYFQPTTGVEGLPNNVFPWGSSPLLNVEGGLNEKVSFSIQKDDVGALELAQDLGRKLHSKIMNFSLFSLPINTQQVFQVLLMVPVGAFIVLCLRVFIGLETLGTFMPVLIALAFRETQVLWGVSLFCLVSAIGLAIRAYLEHMKLLAVPRLAVILTVVVILIAMISIVSHKLDLEHGLSIALFPMVILTMTIERMSILWEERGPMESITTGARSLFAATIAYFVMIHDTASYLVFTFPGILLVLIGIMLLMGRYRGYRLLELIRFREFLMTEK